MSSMISPSLSNGIRASVLGPKLAVAELQKCSDERLRIFQKMARFDRLEMRMAQLMKGKLLGKGVHENYTPVSSGEPRVKDPGKFLPITSPSSESHRGDEILPLSPFISSNPLPTSSTGLKCEDELCGLTCCHGKSMESESARKVFDVMSDKNKVSWTSMIYGYRRCGLAKDTIKLFSQIMRDDEITVMKYSGDDDDPAVKEKKKERRDELENKKSNLEGLEQINEYLMTTSKRSPSIIASLMGLDVLPPQSSSHRQQKYLENQQGSSYDGYKSLGRRSKGEQKFKDVFEVLDAKKAETAFMRQKFMEDKRLSTNDILRHSKEFYDALEALDSNKDHLFTEHLHDLQSILHKPQYSQASSLKSPNYQRHVDRLKTQKVDRDLLRKNRKSPHQHGGGGCPSRSDTRHVSYDSLDLQNEKLDKRVELNEVNVAKIKRKVLNETWWFNNTQHITLNAIDTTSDRNVVIAKKCSVFSIEFVVRGYVTGSIDTSLWTAYKKGVRNYCGNVLSDGLVKNEKLPVNIFTPTTKVEDHDMPITPNEIVESGYMTQTELEEATREGLHSLALGALDNSFLVGDSGIQVYKNMRQRIQGKGVCVNFEPGYGRSHSLAPRKALLMRVETNMSTMSHVSQTPHLRGIYQLDIETEKVISEWKFEIDGVDTSMGDITNDGKDAQLDPSASMFLGLDNNRLCRWDIRDQYGMIQVLATTNTPVLNWAHGHQFSRGINFHCFATFGKIDKAMDMEGSNMLALYKTKRSVSTHYNTPPSRLMEKAAEIIGAREVMQGSTCESYRGVTFGFPIDLVASKNDNQLSTDLVCDAPHVRMTSGYKDPDQLEPSLHLYMKNHVLINTSAEKNSSEMVPDFGDGILVFKDTPVMLFERSPRQGRRVKRANGLFIGDSFHKFEKAAMTCSKLRQSMKGEKYPKAHLEDKVSSKRDSIDRVGVPLAFVNKRGRAKRSEIKHKSG